MPTLNKLLNHIEKTGNRLPHPTLLFIYLSVAVALLSALMAGLNASATHPSSGEVIHARNLISADGLRYVLGATVSNFVNFAPVGSVLLAVLGIGIAEHSGLISAVLRRSVLRAPERLVTFAVVLCSVLSSIALDTGYVVLIPLAAIIFQALGRNPLAGIVAAFAGVSGGFSANIIVGPLDAVLSGISTEAAQLMQADYEVSVTANYYFIFVSTFLIAAVGTFVTEKVVVRWLPDAEEQQQKKIDKIPGESTALKAVTIFSLIFFALLLYLTVPEHAILRDAKSGSLLRSPFMNGIVVIISLYAGLAGLVFAKFSKQHWQGSFLVEAMEKHMATMTGYLVLMFFAAQFVNYFGWSQLGVISAIQGAELITQLQLPKAVLLVLFIFLAALINLFVGSASAKWALIAPIFVPMFFLLGIAPEATQMAYRIGDSCTNIITPLMPYFGVVIAVAQQYRKDIGIGTLISLMLPYSILFLIAWSLMLALWISFALPLGPGAPLFL
ncbi:AbgT family transporter [Agaribacterium haliotis]|uniref:AbgT family transporter n=1 Tax=Agaribacterium haliotis TaxID=2013869 RepID=UPI000BB585A3|nr:AbgT family transporter [Agaribacterium haliotis]